MATRRQGREWALQMLFQADMNPGLDIEKSIPKFWRQQYTCKVEEAEDRDVELPASKKPVEDRVAPPKIRDFTEKLVRGVLGHLDEIDDKLAAYTKTGRCTAWEPSSAMSCGSPSTSCSIAVTCRPVVLNEAIDLAKYFSNTDSGALLMASSTA